MSSLHEEERASDDRGIFAEEEHPGGFGKVRVDGMEYAVFAGHIVRFWRYGAQRRAAEDVFASAGLYEIDEVRVAVGKLRDADFLADFVAVRFDFPVQVGGQRRHVEFFAVADYGDIGVHFKNVSGRRL